MPSRRHGGLTLGLKRLLGVKELTLVRRAFNALARPVPYGVKYGIGTALRRPHYPYCVIEDGDVVVQVGAPRDLLHSGRSRAVHFTRLVGSGLVVVLEPDPESHDALSRYVERNGLASRMRLFRLGAWSERTTLTFLASEAHPASSLVEGVNMVTPEEAKRRHYRHIVIPVDSIDSVLQQVKRRPPRLVSITTNGAEKQILEGMQETIAAGCAYVSLAMTGEGYIDHMAKLGFERVADDDRGFTFRNIASPRPC